MNLLMRFVKRESMLNMLFVLLLEGSGVALTFFVQYLVVEMVRLFSLPSVKFMMMSFLFVVAGALLLTGWSRVWGKG